MASNFQQALLRELEIFLGYLADGLSTPEGLAELLSQIGWNPNNIPNFPAAQFSSAIGDFVTAYRTGLVPLVSNPPTSLQDLPKALEEAGAVVTAFANIANALTGIPNAPAGLEAIGEDLLGLAAAHYVSDRHRFLLPFFDLLGLVQQQQVLTAVGSDGVSLQRAPITVTQFNIGAIPSLIGNPLAFLKSEYHLENGLAQADLTADKLFPRIANLGQALFLPVVYGFDPTVGVNLGTLGNDRAQHLLLVFIPVAGDQIDNVSGFGVGLALEETQGLVVSPFGSFNVTETLGRWGVQLQVTGNLPGMAISSSGVKFEDSTTSVSFTLSATLLPALQAADSANLPVFQVGSTTGTRLELSQFKFTFNGDFSATSRDFGVLAEIGSGSLILSGGDGDGFLASVLPSSSKADFQFGVGWSTARGLYFKGAAALDVTLPMSISVGGVLTISAIHLTIGVQGSGELDVVASLSAALALGPVEVSVDRVGLKSALTFPTGGGNLGPLNGTLDFQAPSGLGIAIDAGPVSGGGFITFDSTNNRYFGALELSVYSVAVKAFGVIETKLPTGPGYSFLIIISAEFTPIQLGFGFTLNGVGGLLGINRSVDSNGLLTMIKTGQLDNVLFPTDVVDNAPAILNDVETLFPPTKGHYVFGPLAKLGWGTPTLVDGELGLIIEYPGPVLTIIGTVHAALPKQDDAVVELNLDVGGVLDFPNKKFSLDASLHDSRVGDFPITGDMAMRMNWGQNPNFALSLGGFNPHYNPPAGFPKLKPVSVDLGSNGNPSIVLSGYMALTSNTAQLGAKVQASISKGGASLSGFLKFDALFVFSPFSFEADIEGGVSASIDGYGISLDFHGTLSGPSPWHLAGKVCISLWFFSACADFSTSLGGTSQPTLPGVDPWTGSLPANADGTQTVPGLQPALSLSGNWGGNPPPGSFQAVTLVAPAPGTPSPLQTPIDPLGSATFRQKAVPLDLQITAFAGTAPQPVRNLHVSQVVVGPQTVKDPTTVNDYFAPGQYQKMKDADKLSSQSFVQLPGGFTVSSDSLTFGPPSSEGLIYTDVTFAAPVGSPPTTTEDAYGPSQTHVTTVSGQSAATKAGLRNSALAAFVDPKAAPLVNLANELYTIANIGNLAGATGFQTNLPRPVATTALAAAAATSATARQTLQVAPTFFVQPSTFVL